MNDLLKMKDISQKWHVPTTKKGRYNRLVYICPECDNDMLETNFEFAAGFAEVFPGVGMVVERDKCGERYWCHAGMSTYPLFMDTKKTLAIKNRGTTK